MDIYSASDTCETKFVLVVDDDPNCLLVIEKLVSRVMPEVVILTAKDGLEGLEIFKSLVDRGSNIRALLTDYNMPKMTGDVFLTHACHYLQEKQNKSMKEAHTQCAIVTANDMYRNKSPCNGCTKCATAIIYKPYTKTTLQQFLSKG